MKVADEWEALFQIWHRRDHEIQAMSVDLERRIVKLEAYVAARRKEDALMARAIGNLPDGPD